MQKITDLDILNADKYGYCAVKISPQYARWVCKECFGDFAERFGFRLKTNEDKEG